MTVYKYKGPEIPGQKLLGSMVRITGKHEHPSGEVHYKVRKLEGKKTFITHPKWLSPVEGKIRLKDRKGLKEHMLSFGEFLNEALQPLPGKNKGWGDSKKIGGKQVVVQHRKGGLFHLPGTHTTYATVDGRFQKDGAHDPKTTAAIGAFVKGSTKELLRDKNPKRVKIKGNDDKKQRIYNTFAKSKIAKEAGYEAKEKRSSVILKKTSDAPVVKSGEVKRDYGNPAHSLSSKDKSWKKWKNKGDFKQSKFDLKKVIKKAFAGGGGDFGGGGSSGSW